MEEKTLDVVYSKHITLNTPPPLFSPLQFTGHRDKGTLEMESVALASSTAAPYIFQKRF